MYQDYVKSLSPDARRKLAEAIKQFELESISASAEDRRIARMKAATNNPDLEPAVKYANGALRRLGLTVHAAAEADFSAKLDEAMSRAKLATADRIHLKTALAKIGLLD